MNLISFNNHSKMSREYPHTFVHERPVIVDVVALSTLAKYTKFGPGCAPESHCAETFAPAGIVVMPETGTLPFTLQIYVQMVSAVF